MIIDSAIKLGTAFLQLLKKMSFKDIILVILVLTTVSFAWASNNNKNDAIDAKYDLEVYKTNIEAKKYEDKIDALKVTKAKLQDDLDKRESQRRKHQQKSLEWKTKFEDLKSKKPDKIKIKIKVGELNGAKDVCARLNKYGIDCFIYSSN